jgi:hypothetical protein
VSDTSTASRPGRRCRSTKPEQIDIGSDLLVRNDVIAVQQGTSVRTVDRGDAAGAPYILVGGVKYRPLREYQQFLAGRIQRRKQQPIRRRRRT